MTKDELWMSRAIELARKGIYGAPPNPMVGAVLVCDDRIIGEGYHRRCGETHAEVNAFASVKEAKLLARAKMYVTLEPCAHYGHTPPCAKLIIEKGVKEVYVGTTDPFAKVNGAGIKMLREAGVKVVVGVLEEQCRELICHFLVNQLNDRPYVMLKWAQSADGYIDVKRDSGMPTRLSSARSSLRIHMLRLKYQAVMVGTKTALLDNPRLTARLVNGRQPLRIVLDRKGILPENLHIFDETAPTLIVGETDNPIRAKYASYQFMNMDFSQPIMRPLLSALKRFSIQALLVEGGTILLQSFLDEGLWDEIQVEHAGTVLHSGVKAPVIPAEYQAEREDALGSVFMHYRKQLIK